LKDTSPLGKDARLAWAVLESMNDDIVCFGRDGRVMADNSAARAILGVGELLGNNVEQIGSMQAPTGDWQIIQALVDRNVSASGLKLRWGDKTIAISLSSVTLRTG